MTEDVLRENNQLSAVSPCSINVRDKAVFRLEAVTPQVTLVIPIDLNRRDFHQITIQRDRLLCNRGSCKSGQKTREDDRAKK